MCFSTKKDLKFATFIFKVRFSDSTKFCGDKCTCENADKSFRSKQANLIHQPISNDEVVKNLSKAFNLTLHPSKIMFL